MKLDLRQFRNHYPADVVILIVLTLVLGACGKQRPGVAYQERPAVPGSFSGLDENPGQGSDNIPSADLPVSACIYWNKLPTVAPDRLAGSFQFLENLEKTDGVLKGTVNLITLPQARFGFSKEVNEGNSPLPKIWTWDTFYPYAYGEIVTDTATLQKRYDASKDEIEKKSLKKQIKALNSKLRNLKLANNISLLRGKALGPRNEGIVAKVESKLPGAFSGKAGPLSQSPFYLGLVKTLGGSAPNPDFLMANKALLTKRVPRFVSSDWTQRRFDMQKALASLKTPEDGNPTPITPTEMLCRYLVSQRLIAQLIDLKGIEGAPVITATGRLSPLPTAWDTEPVFANGSGSAYSNVVVGEKWINTQLAKEGSEQPRMNGTDSTEQFLEAARFWMSITSHRFVGTWQTGEKPVDGRLNVSPALLKLSFGLLGIHLNIFKATEFTVLPPEVRGPENGYLRLRENAPDNLARLILLTRETQRGMQGLRNPSDFGNVLLKPVQVAAFITPKTGVLDLFAQLQTAASLEGMIRMRQGHGSPSLADVLEDIGHGR